MRSLQAFPKHLTAREEAQREQANAWLNAAAGLTDEAQRNFTAWYLARKCPECGAMFSKVKHGDKTWCESCHSQLTGDDVPETTTVPTVKGHVFGFSNRSMNMPEQPTTSILEKLADEVARDVMPEPQALGEKGIDFVTIITLIISIVQTIIQNCPQPPTQVAASFKKPTFRQRAALLKITKENCDCCGVGRQAGRIHQSILAKAGSLTDVDALAVIKEASDDRNLLL